MTFTRHYPIPGHGRVTLTFQTDSEAHAYFAHLNEQKFLALVGPHLDAGMRALFDEARQDPGRIIE